jgi:hypothetical protein
MRFPRPEQRHRVTPNAKIDVPVTAAQNIQVLNQIQYLRMVYTNIPVLYTPFHHPSRRVNGLEPSEDISVNHTQILNLVQLCLGRLYVNQNIVEAPLVLNPRVTPNAKIDVPVLFDNESHRSSVVCVSLDQNNDTAPGRLGIGTFYLYVNQNIVEAPLVLNPRVTPNAKIDVPVTAAQNILRSPCSTMKAIVPV